MSGYYTLTFRPWSLGRRLRASFFSILLLLPGCAGTRRVDPISPGIMPARQMVEVWRGRRAVTLHGVEIEERELTGIPRFKPVECDSCRVTIALSEVDSMKMVPGDENALLGTGMVIGTLLTVLLAWRAAAKN